MRRREPEPGWVDDDDLYLGPDWTAGVSGREPDLGGTVNPALFRDVLGRFASGITVVTSMSDGVPVGLTCQSFTSVSLDPPLVLFCPSRTSRAWPLIARSGTFCVNILAADQARVSHVMASRGIDKFAEVAWSPSEASGSPVVEGSLAHLDCTVHAVHDGGDHHVVIGRVQHLVAGREGEGLLFFRGGYGATAPGHGAGEQPGRAQSNV